MCQGVLPLDRAGTIILPKLPERELVADYLSLKKISNEILLDHLNGLF